MEDAAKGRFQPGPEGMTLVDTKKGDSFTDRLDLRLYGAHGQTLQALNRLAAEVEGLRSRTPEGCVPPVPMPVGEPPCSECGGSGYVPANDYVDHYAIPSGSPCPKCSRPAGGGA